MFSFSLSHFQNVHQFTPYFSFSTRASTSSLSIFLPTATVILTACPENNKIWISDVPTHDQGSAANRNCSWPNRQGSGHLSLLVAQVRRQPPSPAAGPAEEEEASHGESRGSFCVSFSPREPGQLSGSKSHRSARPPVRDKTVSTTSAKL